MDTIVSAVQKFYNLIEVNVNIKPDFVFEDEIDGTKDAICIVGNKARDVVGLAFGTYCTSGEQWGGRLIKFLENPNILEKGHTDTPRQLSIVSVERVTDNVISQFNAKTKEKTVAFLVFHATGHNAGITHERCDFGGLGYMSDASVILWYLGWESCGFTRYGGGDYDPDKENSCVKSLEELITEKTIKKYLDLVKRRYE